MSIIDPFKAAPGPSNAGIVDPFKAAPKPVLQRAPREETGFFDALGKGFKRSLPETKAMLGGATALAGDLVGADAVRDYGIGVYQETMDKDVAPLQTAQFSDVMDGEAGVGEFVGGAIGNFGGQLLQSGAAAAAGALGGAALGAPTGAGAAVTGTLGAIGGLLGRRGAKQVVGELTEKLIADQIKKGVGREVAEAGARSTLQRIGLGAAAAPIALNVGQESGGTYMAARDEAAADGRELTTADNLRVLGSGVASGLVDTAADLTGISALGGRFAGSLGARVAAGALAQGAIEGTTETVQQGLQRFGAQQDLTGEEAAREYLDSFAAGAVGGGAIGGAGGLRAPVEQDPTASGAPDDEQAEQTAGAAPPPEVAAREVELRRAVALAKTVPEKKAAESALAAFMEEQGRMLPAPGQSPVAVSPSGEARTAEQTLGMAQQRAAELQQQAEVGLTPDVLAAQQRDPRVPRPMFPGAAAGTTADAANALPASVVATQPPALTIDDIKRRPDVTPTAGVLFQPGDTMDPITGRRIPATPQAPPAGMDPETGEVQDDREDRARAAILQQRAQGQSPNARLIAGATGLTPERVAELSADIAAERKAAALAERELRLAAKDQPTPSPSAVLGETPLDDAAVTGEAPLQTREPAAVAPRAEAPEDVAPAPIEEPSAAPTTASEVEADAPGSAGAQVDPVQADPDDPGVDATTEMQASEAAEPVAARVSEDAGAQRDAPVPAVVEVPSAPEPSGTGAPQRNAYRAAADAIDATQPVEAALSNLDDAQARALGKALGMSFSPKAGRAKIIERLAAVPRDDFIQRGVPALRQLAQQEDPASGGDARGGADAAPEPQASERTRITADNYRGALSLAQGAIEQRGLNMKADALKAAMRKALTARGVKAAGTRAGLIQQAKDSLANGDVELLNDLGVRVAPSVMDALLAKREGRVGPDDAGGRRVEASRKPPRAETLQPNAAGAGVDATAEVLRRQQPDPEAPARFARIDEGFEQNRERLAKQKFKKGETVSYMQNGVVKTGVIESIEKDQGMAMVGNAFVAVRRLFRPGDEAPTPAAPAAQEEASPIAAAAAEAATSPTNDLPAPTDAQKEAGNYKKGHVALNGLDITIENPAGSKRREEWPALAHHYGYIKRTEGADGDHVDVFLSDDAGDADLPVFVVDQRNRDGGFDEHKVLLGFKDEAAARVGYLANYSKGWRGLGAITPMSLDEFKAWLRDGDTTKPVAYVPPAEPVAAAVPAPAAPAAGLRPKVRVKGGKPEYVLGHPDTLAAYFAPGRIIKGYGGLDRVLEFRPTDGDRNWSVRVQRVDDNGEPVPNENPRWHSTSPEPRDLVRDFGPPVAPVKASRAERAPQPAADASAAPAIDDFGETLLGARKHLAGEYAKRLDDAATLDVAAEPLSRTWPEPDYQKLLDNGADPFVVGFVRAMRDEIPRKPVAKWKIGGWAKKVTELRNFATALLKDGEVGKRLAENLARPDYAGTLGMVKGRAELYQEFGHERSLQGVRFGKHHYTLYRGEKDVTRWTVEKDRAASAYSNWPHELAVGKTREEAIEAFRAFLAKEADADQTAGAAGAKMPRFDIYSRRRGEGFIIGVRLRGGDALDLRRFADVKEARAFLAVDENKALLANEVRKLREVPSIRGDLNAPRVGVDHRAGADVTPEQFAEAFGFRGVQFGNYVEGPRRQQDLNNAYDALMDLAGVIGIPPRALSLNGTLGLAFGARGKGGKNAGAAHFEPGTIVINLTKGAGAGSLAHEWFHGLDNYFARQRGAPLGFATVEAKAGDAHRELPMRPEMRSAFLRLVKAIHDTGVKARSDELDKLRSKAYWGTKEEMAARAFESYVIAKLGEGGASNDYLANVVPETAFSREGGYPYPTAAELPIIRAAFDDFFRTVETGDGQGGAVALFSMPAQVDERLGEAIAEFEEALQTPADLLDAVEFIISDSTTVPQSVVDAARRFRQELNEDADEWGGRGDSLAAGEDFVDAVTRAVSGAAFSLPTVPFAEQVRARLAAGDRRGESLDMGRTPAVLRMLGAPDAAMRMPAGVLFKIATGKDGDRPPLTQRQVERLPEALDEAIAVFDSATQPGALVVLTNLADRNGNPVIAAVEINTVDRSDTGPQAFNTVNVLTSAYGKDGAQAWVDQQVKAGRLRFHNDEGSGASVPGRALNLPTGMLGQSLTERSVLRSADLRNFRAASRVQQSTAPNADGPRGLDGPELDAAIKAITDTWQGDAPPVSVRATPEDLPDGLADDPGSATAEGVYYRGRVYLIASNIRSMQRAKQVLAHEAFGHYGVEAIVGEREWGAITRDVAAMRRNRTNLSDALKSVFESADLRYAKADPQTYAKEVIAIMAEQGVQSSVVGRVIGAVRRLLRLLGILDGFNEADLRDLVTRGMRRVEGRRSTLTPRLRDVMGAPRPVFSFSMSPTATASRVLRLMGKHDDLFKFKKSSALTLDGVFDDLKLGFSVTRTGDLRIPFEHDGSDSRRPPVADVYTIRRAGAEQKARLFVERGGKNRMYLDISEFQSGEGLGAGVYAALFNFAHNAGKVFIGDPTGLSDEALLRRTEHMLSAALKFGTTRMMEPHPRQVDPRGQFEGYQPQTWAHPLEWVTGNDAHNIAALLDASYHNHRQFIMEVPGVREALRDLPVGGDSVLRGGELPVGELVRIAREAGARFGAHPGASFGRGRAPAFGPSSVARFVLTERLVRGAASAERLAILVHVANELSAGRLSPALNDLFYSQPGPDAQQPGEPLFSQPAPEDVEKAVAASVADPPLSERARQAFEDATTGGNLQDLARRGLLYTITLRHIAEYGGKLLPELKDFVNVVQQMASDRTQMQEDVAKTADTWDRQQRKDRRGADAMANLAHDATIEGVDPDVEYKPLTFATFRTVKEGGVTTQRRVELPVNRRNIDEAVNALKARRRTADDATKKELTEQIAQLEARLAQEQKRSAAHPVLLARWQALPEAWKAIYREARDAYTAQSKRYEEALIAKIEALVADGKTRASYIASIRQQFESQRVEGPYFPLARFGNLYVSAVSPSGEQVFSMYESVAEWKRAQADLRRRGYTKIKASEKIGEVRNGGGPSSAFMADLMDTLGKAGVDDDAKDAVYQLYLRSMPDLSIRKSFIHRKKTAGYSKDALRAFAVNLFHGSFQIARLRHSHHLDAALDNMKDREEALRETDPEKAQQAAIIINEMEKRHEWVMNPQDSAVANALTSLGFVWYLGISPAAAIVNLTQVPIVSFPVLAAKFGFGKASAALLDGMKRAIRNVNGDITRGLDEEERRAFKVWYEAGAIDKTLTHSLAGLADSDTTQFSPVYRRTMEIVSLLFHKAEVVNREATALAAFRLAREGGMDFNAATQYANDVVWESQFDYSSPNRARVMQGNTQKVLFMFRQYSLNMTWFLWRNAIQALKGESHEVKRDAQRKLAGIMGMTTLFAGTLGLPMVSVAFGVANAAAAAFGDDEEPWDAEIAFRNFLADYLGPDAARLLTGGAIEAATGVEISSRTSLNDLWYRSPDRELEGEGAWAHVLETIAGPVGGIFKGVFVSGPSLIEEGHVWRGIEAMVPKFIRDGMRSIRYTTEGVNTINGMPVISDLTLTEEIAQLSGFGPSRLADRYDANNAARNYADRLTRRRQRLLNALSMSIQAGDQDEVRETLERIRKWNTEVPQLAIDRRTIDRSLAQRARYRDRAVSGVVLDRRIEQQAAAQGRFAEEE